MALEPNIVADGFITLEGGMDSGRDPALIDRNKVASARNVAFRGGQPENRPGFKKHALIFKSGATWTSDLLTTYPNFQTTLFQGAGVYKHSNSTVIVMVAGGRFFSIDVGESVEASTVTSLGSVSGHKLSELILIGSQYAVLENPGVSSLAAGASSTINVSSTSLMSLTYPQLTIAGTSFTITAIPTSKTVTIRNDGASASPIIAAGELAHFQAQEFNSPVTRCYFQQAEQFLIIQDGQSKPVIFDGASLRRAVDKDQNGYPEIPTGTAMAYGNGRLWIAVNGNNFVAGDIVGGPTGRREYNYADAILKMTENTYLNEGGSFRVPSQAGDITSMMFTSVPDTSLGQGPLQIFTQSHAVSVNPPVQRVIWKEVDFPIQTVTLVGNGAMSDRSTVLINGDIFYRAKDGIRSLVLARREMGQWGNTPLSSEVQETIGSDSQALLKFSSAVVFDNRFIMTADPVPLANGCYHRSLVALDFHPISSMGIKAPPAYDGYWDMTELQRNFYQLLTVEHDGESKCFMFCRNSSNATELWEITKADWFDNAASVNPTRINSHIDTASYSFSFGQTASPSNALELKELIGGELSSDKISGAVDFTVLYKPEQTTSFEPWHGWTETVTYQNCASGCRPIVCYKPGYRSRMRLPIPPDECNTENSRPFRFGYEFQARLAWTGRARIKRFKMFARKIEQENYGECR